MSDYQFISFDIPDVDKFIKNLDDIREELNNDVKQSLENSAKEVEQEQKRLISSISDKLPNHIGIEEKITKKGNMYYHVGYVGNVKEWLYGAVIEFGRPGKQGKGTIKQNRNGQEVEVRNGYIAAYPHIRRGFDNKKEVVVNNIKNSFNNVVDNMERKLNNGDT